MKNTIVFLLLFICLGAAAQKHKPQFNTMVQGGLLEGERGSAFQVKAINGFVYKTWTGGIGVGLDYYHTRTIPVFLDVRKSFGKGTRTPFVYASGGPNFPWLKDDESYGLKPKAGLYIDAGVGYQMPVMKSSAFFFSTGYSQKSFKEKETQDVIITIYPMPPYYGRTFEYTLRRLSIQVGLRF